MKFSTNLEILSTFPRIRKSSPTAKKIFMAFPIKMFQSLKNLQKSNQNNSCKSCPWFQKEPSHPNQATWFKKNLHPNIGSPRQISFFWWLLKLQQLLKRQQMKLCYVSKGIFSFKTRRDSDYSMKWHKLKQHRKTKTKSILKQR